MLPTQEGLNQEALGKIQTQRQGTNWVIMARQLFPDVDKEVREGSINLKERVLRFRGLIDGTSDTDLLTRARTLYDGSIQGGDFMHAYNIAHSYLDTPAAQRAGNELLNKQISIVRQARGRSEERRKAAAEILSGEFVPEVGRDSSLVEEVAETLFGIRDRRKHLTETDYYRRNLPESALRWLKLPLRNELLSRAARDIAREHLRRIVRYKVDEATRLAGIYLGNGLITPEQYGELIPG